MKQFLNDVVAAGRTGADLSGPVACDYPAFYVSLQSAARSKSNFRSDDTDWRALKAFEANAAARYRLALPATWTRPAARPGPVERRPRVVAVLWAATTIDAGNLSKSLLDAGKSILFADDAEVAADVSFTTRRMSNRWVLAAFAQLPPAASLRECAGATTLLTEHVVSLLEAHDTAR